MVALASINVMVSWFRAVGDGPLKIMFNTMISAVNTKTTDVNSTRKKRRMIVFTRLCFPLLFYTLHIRRLHYCASVLLFHSITPLFCIFICQTIIHLPNDLFSAYTQK